MFITFDEGEGEANHIPTIVVSTRTPPGTRSARSYDHYSLLRTMEDLLGLQHLGHAGDPGRESLVKDFLVGP